MCGWVGVYIYIYQCTYPLCVGLCMCVFHTHTHTHTLTHVSTTSTHQFPPDQTTPPPPPPPPPPQPLRSKSLSRKRVLSRRRPQQSAPGVKIKPQKSASSYISRVKSIKRVLFRICIYILFIFPRIFCAWCPSAVADWQFWKVLYVVAWQGNILGHWHFRIFFGHWRFFKI